MSARTPFYLPQQSGKQHVNTMPWTVEAVAANEEIDPFEFVRTIAVARVTMPRAMVRLSAGREQMDDSLQALCFLAGANSLFYGGKLLVTSNPLADRDRRLLQRLGIATQQASQLAARPDPAPATRARVPARLNSRGHAKRLRAGGTRP